MVGNKRDAEPAIFVIIIGAAVTGEFNGRAHFLEDLQVIVQAAFGNADLFGAPGGGAGAFQMDKVVEADEPV